MPLDSPETYRFGDFLLDVPAYALRRGDRSVRLERRPMDLLILLLRHHGQLVSREEIVNRLWGPDVFVEVDAGIHTAIRKIRRALRDSADTPTYVETVSARGYRFIAPVEVVAAAAAQAPAALVERPRDEEEPRRARAAVALGIIVLATASLGLPVVRSAPSALPPRTVAVLPFKPLVAADRDEALELGVTETLITQLGALRRIQVRPLSAVRRFANLEQDSLAAGRELGVDAVLEAHFQRSGEITRFTLRLIDVRDGSTRWSDRVEGPGTGLLSLQDAVAARVAAALTTAGGASDRARLPPPPTRSPDAYLAYVRGRYHLWQRTVRDNHRAAALFQQAIAFDARYAAAYAGLAEAYAMVVGQLGAKPHDLMPKAREMALQALALDESLAEAHTALAIVRAQYDYDYAGAEEAHRRALALDPQVSDLFAYGHYLRTVGRFDEALAMFERARELDPLWLEIQRAIAHVHFAARRFDEAIALSLKIIELDPNFSAAYWVIYRAYEAKGMYAEATAAHLKMLTLDGGHNEPMFTALGAARAKGDWPLYWRTYLGFVGVERAPGFQVAELYARLGDTEEAIRFLQRGYEERSGYLQQLVTNPIWDGLRADSRFEDLLRRANLPPPPPSR